MIYQKERSSNPALFITSQASQCSRKVSQGVVWCSDMEDLTAAYVLMSVPCTLQVEFLSWCCEICCPSSAGMWKFSFQENYHFGFAGGMNWEVWE